MNPYATNLSFDFHDSSEFVYKWHCNIMQAVNVSVKMYMFSERDICCIWRTRAVQCAGILVEFFRMRGKLIVSTGIEGTNL